MDYKDFAKKYIGVKEWSTEHKKIIDYYNKNCKPLPRSYKVKYNDSWCAAFISFILLHFNCVNAPYECSANRMYEKCKKNKQIVKKPKVNDIVFYQWKCNGYVNHVGIISKIQGNFITVIEGNKNNKVGTRNITTTSPYILAFGRIKEGE